MQESINKSKQSDKIEAWTGIMIAVIAAIMTIMELMNKNIEEEMMRSLNKNHMYYNWYQSKSVKQSLKESELMTLEAIQGGKHNEFIKKKISKVEEEIQRYKAEKKEILEGSSTLPKDKWVQDLNGKFGVIVGVNQYEAIAQKLDNSSYRLDLGQIFFQISIVLGAVCIVIHDNIRVQRKYLISMVLLTILGLILSFIGIYMASLI